MPLFSEREGRRQAPASKEQMTCQEYEILLDVCRSHFVNLAWLFPIPCPDNATNITGTDEQKLDAWLSIEIPTLYRDGNNNWLVAPRRESDFDQFALLDLIEYVAVNMRDYTNGNYHPFFGHHELNFSKSKAEVFFEFQKTINKIFDKTGLQYVLTASKQIERKITTGAAATIAPLVQAVQEPGLKQLLNEALGNFKSPRPADKQASVEKLWDAFERLKTYYVGAGVDKRASSVKIVADMADGSTCYSTLFDAEFKALTTIGNDYRIRHHEINKIEIINSEDYDYFFNRCLALIERALKTLPR